MRNQNLSVRVLKNNSCAHPLPHYMLRLQGSSDCVPSILNIVPAIGSFLISVDELQTG